MAKEKFKPFMDHLLVNEGGYVNNPADPGGATNKGVTQRVYDAYRARVNGNKQSVRLITDAEVRAIYKRQYWDVVKGDDLPAGVDYVVADGAVNSGPQRAGIWLQAAMNLPVIDGIIGEATVQAARFYPDHDELVRAICARRLAFMKQCKTKQGTSAWAVFGKGWSRRIAENLKTGQAWASGRAAPLPAKVTGSNAKAEKVDHPSEKMATIADGSVAGGGASTVISGAATQIQPLTDSSLWIAHIFIALTLAGVCLTAAGFGLRWYRNQRAERAAKAENGSAVADLSEVEDLAEMPAAA